jgi:hypothetical protein
MRNKLQIFKSSFFAYFNYAMKTIIIMEEVMGGVGRKKS